ncbi:MAG: RnfABCDGE type electron transport complex subunit D [Candidatus Paceibacterota bacterium]
MLKSVDTFLNNTTTYRLVLYYLTLLVGAALLFDIFGVLHYSPLDFLFSLLVLVAACWAVNTAFAKILSAATNIESVYITAFILALIINPVAPTDAAGVGLLIIAAAIAMASKYVLALDEKHPFNPAALGVAVPALLGIGSASWWVGGNLPLLPFVLVGGALVVRKVRRFDLVATFIIVALVTTVLTAHVPGDLTTIQRAILDTPLLFFAFVMLTEPITLPPTRRLRMLYAALVGIFFAPNIHLGAVYLSPELALLLGNVFSFMVSSEGRYTLRLVEKTTPAPTIDELVFASDRRIPFKAGQYLEFTLPHDKPDLRGNRRYFTIASSPTEENVRLGVKFYEPTSSFKIALGRLKLGDTISASQVAGDFVLPRNPGTKLAFFAGGIGVTPFRAHVQYLMDTQQQRDVVLLYASKPEDIVYQDVFDRARDAFNLKTAYVPAFIDAELIAKEIPDYAERTFYISGPPPMVDTTRKALRALGVSRFNIVTDYFPGLA